MRLPRSLRFHACLVLAWFALVQLAGVVAPAVSSGAWADLCSVTTADRSTPAGDDGMPAGHAGLHCPLCGAPAAPPPSAAARVVQGLAPWRGWVPVALAPAPSSPSAAPLPGRGPPSRA